jgi:hypothetical protein
MVPSHFPPLKSPAEPGIYCAIACLCMEEREGERSRAVTRTLLVAAACEADDPPLDVLSLAVRFLQM